jgi:hypothetical protein
MIDRTGETGRLSRSTFESRRDHTLRRHRSSLPMQSISASMTLVSWPGHWEAVL